MFDFFKPNWRNEINGLIHAAIMKREEELRVEQIRRNKNPTTSGEDIQDFHKTSPMFSGKEFQELLNRLSKEK